MKKYLIFALAAATGLAASARGLSAESALQRALASEGNGPRRAAALNPSGLKLVSTGARLKAGDGNAFYVFSRPNGGGYLVASGDDRLRPVLAVSESGTLDPANMPESLQWWLGEYEAEIAACLDAAPQQDEPAADSGNIYDYYASWTPIEPLVKVNWDQLAPYNKLCPVISGETSATGCVATAMAQVIHSLGYVQGQGKHTYAPPAGGGNLTFDFENWKPDFSKMPASLTKSSPADQIDEVANLMFACGVAVDMSYNIVARGGSGAGDPVPGLTRFLGYDKSSATYRRSYFSTPDWEKFIYHQLSIGRPVFYAGSSNTGGHAFVCDGYSADGMFHFNWGWSGMSNGYFSLSVLNPSNQGVGSFAGGYNLGHQISLFVVPGTEAAPAVPESATPFKLEYIPNGNADLPQPEANGSVDFFPMMYHFAWSPDSKSYDVGISLLLKSVDGSVDDIFIEPNAYKTTHCSNAITWNFEADFSKVTVPAGTYCAYIAYCVKGFDGTWLAERYPRTANDHYRLVVNEKGERSYSYEMAHNPGIEIYNIKTNDLYAADKENRVDFLIANSDKVDFGETVSLRLFANGSTDGSKATVLGTSVLYLPAGEVRPVSMTFAGQPAGKYTIRLYRDATNAPLGNNSLDVTMLAGSRPETIGQGSQGLCEVGLWINGAGSSLAELDLTAGVPFSATTALLPFVAQKLDYSISFFAHGLTSDPLRTYPVASRQVPLSEWARGDDFTVKPDLEPGLYTVAFTDNSGTLLSYAVDCHINVAANDMTYRIESGKATLFAAAPAIEKAAIPSAVAYGGKSYEVVAIGDGVFSGNRALSEVEIPASVTSIGHDAFHATTGLDRVYLRGASAPFENSLIPFRGTNPDAAFYVDGAGYDAYAPKFPAHDGLYALITGLKAPAEATATVHATTDVSLEVSPAAHTDPRFSVQVADPAIVSATALGTTLSLTGLAAGTTTVTLTSAQPGVAPVSVKVSVDDFYGVTLDRTAATIGIGETLNLVASAEPAGLDLDWSSSDPKVASVDHTGAVTAVGRGEATITVKSKAHPEASATCAITAVQYVTDFILESTEMTLTVGDKVQLNAEPVPADADNKKFTWSSSDQKVAFVSRTGSLNVRAAGKATLTVTASDAGGAKREIQLTVVELSGIDEVSAGADSGSAEFFDLSGRKIAKPGRGVYIRRAAGKSAIIRL